MDQTSLTPSDEKALAAAVERLALCEWKSQELLSILSAGIRRLLPADGASVVLRAGSGFRYAADDGIGPLWRRFPIKSGISGWVIDHARQAVIEDIDSDSRVPIEAVHASLVKGALVVPIRNVDGAEPLGALGAYWASRHMATDREIELLDGLARATASTLR